ncbi:MAG: glycerol-3-phosphate dehydrogenase/oxidase [Planctomycetota bacterium]|jgi:glycerol-3-phosphate dehydrogenase
MASIHKLLPREVDCLILGGGITGAGIARDAAIRGLSCLLVDSHDFASGTSHLTSKLIHGGLRYLEHAHIKPVIEGIVERDRLLHKLAPNLVKPMKFVMPFEAKQFPKWLATVFSLQIYGLSDLIRDHRWSGGILAPGLRRDYPQIRSFPMSISFWDAQANDARLVIASLRSAVQEGATLSSYTKIKEASFDGGAWNLLLERELDHTEWQVKARTIVNATGPWSPLTAKMLGVQPKELMWIKGSHILLRRPEAFGNDSIVIRSRRNDRPMWAVPWENRLIVGSTESRYAGNLRDARPGKEEVDDLFETFLHYFPTLGVTRDDIRCAFAGVRPIIAQETDDENSLSRKHRIVVDAGRRLITINGGKLTTFRLMAHQAIDNIEIMLGQSPISRDVKLRLRTERLWPYLSRDRMSRLEWEFKHRYAGIRHADQLVDHLVQYYGSDARIILEDIHAHPEHGEPLSEHVPYSLAEFGYLCQHEEVCHLSDLVKRRTSFYFLVDDPGFDKLARIANHVAPILGWDARRKVAEVSAVAFEFGSDLAAVSQEPVDNKTKDGLPACA